ncbi:MAG TPA: hypothetical protein VJN18_09270 [Polyangiaceae bacterium]|nr:hypothetical protein [Polyangiaceae bacterium]
MSERERQAVADASASLQGYAKVHDRALSARAAALLADQMGHSVLEIEDRDTLPNACHVINGWGNAPLKTGSMIDAYARYVHRTDHGVPHVLQCDDEGDFHPWQSFAYAVMAGIAPDTPIADAGCNLFELALGSRSLNTKDGCELGHLLYTAAHFGLPGETPFALLDEVRTLEELVDMAIDAHIDGHFRVCRKVHLTEGLCAISALDPEFSEHRETAQGFLNGQLDLLPVLWAALLGARQARENRESIAPGSLVHTLRESLVVEGFLENHYYLAGHLIELLALAHGFGFEASELHWAAARAVVDELNRLLPAYLPEVFFPACFLHFGHYRRAITLLDALADGKALDPAARAHFTADFRGFRRQPSVAPKPGDGIFKFGRSDEPMREALANAVDAYRAVAASELGPRGNGAHFRRVLVPGWPRWLHFEIFDYTSQADPSRNRGLGVELHIEKPQGSGLFPAIERVASKLRLSPTLPPCELDPSWWGNSGRLRICFDDDAAPSTIALALRELIDVATPILNGALGKRPTAVPEHAH